jgi:hypothetical protein
MTAGASRTAIEVPSPAQRIVTLRFGVEAMPRKPIGETAMTDAERQARYRAARATETPCVNLSCIWGR